MLLEKVLITLALSLPWTWIKCPTPAAKMTGTDHLTATAPVSRLNNRGTAHSPFGLNVLHLPQDVVKAVMEVEALTDRGLCQAFPAHPQNTFGSMRPDRHPPWPIIPTHDQVTWGAKSDDRTTKSIIELPSVSWSQVCIWTPLCLHIWYLLMAIRDNHRSPITKHCSGLERGLIESVDIPRQNNRVSGRYAL